jgi:hypothetical protein
MQWCLPWLPTDRISRMVLLNTGLPPHTLFREYGLANAVLVAIWQLAVMLVGRYVQVGWAHQAGFQGMVAGGPVSSVCMACTAIDNILIFHWAVLSQHC